MDGLLNGASAARLGKVDCRHPPPVPAYTGGPVPLCAALSAPVTVPVTWATAVYLRWVLLLACVPTSFLVPGAAKVPSYVMAHRCFWRWRVQRLFGLLLSRLQTGPLLLRCGHLGGCPVRGQLHRCAVEWSRWPDVMLCSTRVSAVNSWGHQREPAVA